MSLDIHSQVDLSKNLSFILASAVPRKGIGDRRDDDRERYTIRERSERYAPKHKKTSSSRYRESWTRRIGCIGLKFSVPRKRAHFLSPTSASLPWRRVFPSVNTTARIAPAPVVYRRSYTAVPDKSDVVVDSRKKRAFI